LDTNSYCISKVILWIDYWFQLVGLCTCIILIVILINMILYSAIIIRKCLFLKFI
jgi:hypothetical protein